MTFKIEQTRKSLPYGLNRLWSATQIVYVGIPVAFRVTTPDFAEPFVIEFVLCRDEERHPCEIVKERMSDPFGYRIVLYNPGIGGGQSHPNGPNHIIAVNNGQNLLSFIFHLQHFVNSEMYLLFLEFQEDTITTDSDPAMRQLFGRNPSVSE